MSVTNNRKLGAGGGRAGLTRRRKPELLREQLCCVNLMHISTPLSAASQPGLPWTVADDHRHGELQLTTTYTELS